MKKPITFSLLVGLFFASSSLYPQVPSSGTDEIFSILEIQSATTNYSIATCRSYIGKTIQFQLPLNQTKIGLNKKQGSLAIGTQVVADFKAGTASLKNNSIVKFKLIKPNFSRACCNISEIENSMDYTKCYITAKKDTANGRTYFVVNISMLNQTLPFKSQIGMPIYEKYYNGKRYAILKTFDAEESEYMTLSYEFGFMTNEMYDSIKKANNPSSNTDAGSISSNNPDLPYELLAIPNGQNLTFGYITIAASIDAEYTIKLINPFDNTIISSFDQSHIPSNIIASTYDMEISGKALKLIPVKNGQTTRIKAGALNINTLSPWTLYDENKVRTIYSSTVSKKVEFPKGIYQLEVNGLDHQIVIKDGETLEYNDDGTQAQTQKLNTNTKRYELIKNPLLKGATGKLFLNLPDDAEYVIKILASGNKKYIGQFFKGDKIGLFPGSYYVYLYGAEVPDVEIQKGSETRLKVGVLNLTSSLDYRVYGPFGNTYVELFTGPKKVGLPIGTYSISVNGQSQEITIKDGEVTDF